MKPNKKVTFVAVILAVSCSACVGPITAGPYPHGFVTGSQMHYWQPDTARVLFGPPAPIPDPLASGYVVTDSDGHVYLSPKLARAMRR